MSSLPAMTAAEALGSMPDLIRIALGDRALGKCFSSAGLPNDASERGGGYVTEASIERFLDRAAQQAGDDLFGLRLFPHLSVKEYGVWGDYVLEAPTLRDAFKRAASIIHLHADRDSLVHHEGASSSRLEYTFAERHGRGYRQIALAALGPMLSIPRHYLGASWLPLSVDLDLGDKETANRIEAVLESKVQTDQNCIAIEISNSELSAVAEPSQDSWITVHDVERACCGGPPIGLIPIVESLLRQRLGVDELRLDEVAKSMSSSRRTLQRHLDREGTEFRKLVVKVKMQRARELLTTNRLTVSEIGLHLGYSTAGHFARAFKKEHGISPLDHRASQPLSIL